jgi:hypothetical protein
MKLPIAWLVRLGLAGSCLVVAGCGGSDVPDPDSDSHAAAEAAPKAGGPPANVALNSDEQPAAPAPEPAPAGGGGGPAEVTIAPKGAPAAPPAGGGSELAGSGEAPAGAPAAAAPADEPAAAKGGDSGSSTAEMLALANGPAAPTEPDKAPEGGDAAPPQNSGYPGAIGSSGAPGAPPGGSGGAMAGMSIDPRGMNPGGRMPGAPGGPGGRPGMPGGGMPGMPGMATGEGSGAPGMMFGGGPGGANANNAPADFSDPISGVQSFLAALRAKDPVKLAEATALRAPTEASAGNRKLFEGIVFQDLTEDSIAELAQKLEGYAVSGYNQQKSMARIGITLTKQSGTSVLRRTITMRKEKAGWKVVDIGGQGELDKPIIIPGFRGGRGRRR